MNGATSDYSGRQRQDKATVNRFAFVEFDYDEQLELAAAGTDQRDWVLHVQSLRKALVSLGQSAPDILITPRASINGAAMLRQTGLPWDVVESATIFVGCSEDDRIKVKAAVKR